MLVLMSNNDAQQWARLSGVVPMDDKLAADEARRSVQHGSVKAQVEGEVQSEIADHAQAPAAGESQKVEQVARDFRSKAVNEVVNTEREVERRRGAARVFQIVDY